MEMNYEVVYDSGNADLEFSIRRQAYIEVNGQRAYVGLPERLAVYPGDFEEVEAFAPALLPVFRALWTDEVVAAWKQKAEIYNKQ